MTDKVQALSRKYLCKGFAKIKQKDRIFPRLGVGSSGWEGGEGFSKLTKSRFLRDVRHLLYQILRGLSTSTSPEIPV
jgi:hypothetical protein